jgi:LemA protein
MTVKLIAGLAGVGLFVLIVIFIYNKLVRLRYIARNAWSDIDVHLKKRYDLVPNLVESVKGYAGHESETFIKVTQLRSAAMRSDSPGEKAKADNRLMETLRGLLAVVEAYPELKADKQFQELMADMKGIEDNIENARRYYNASVRDYNIATEVFPTNIVASAFSFTPEEFFELDDEMVERKPVRASFTKA